MHDTDTEELEIYDDDYVITDCGYLGSRYHVSILNRSFDEWDEARDAILRHMNAAKFWPLVWYINDHGNVTAVSLND